MRKLLIILPIIIFLSSCSHTLLPDTSSATEVGKVIVEEEQPISWYNYIAVGLFIATTIFAINNMNK